MDKKNSKKTEPNKLDKKDRGDNLKKIERTVRKTLDLADNLKAKHPGGDTDRNVTKSEKPKIVALKKSDEKSKVTDLSKESLPKKLEKIDELKPDLRKKIREKYTLKFKSSTEGKTPMVKREDVPKAGSKVPNVEVKSDRSLKKPCEQKEKVEPLLDAPQSDNKQEKSKDSVHRKPIIKTVTAKYDTSKIYKAVTFVEQKKGKPTPLQIKIPNDIKKNTKAVDTGVVTIDNMNKKIKAAVSRMSLKEKQGRIRKKIEKKKKSIQRTDAESPDFADKYSSPPTEVAKWAPSCINGHTKPYYEAWVSTTLAAISKNSKKDKLFLEKQNILQTFQRALAERPATPELVYENCNDERYTGRIKIKQR